MARHTQLASLLEAIAAAFARLINGDPKPYLALWSHADDVTVMGGFGAFEVGWPGVRQNTKFAAARFRSGRSRGIDQLAWGESGDLAYTVWIERAEVTVEGRQAPAPIAIRVTHLYRREDGAWKIIHRHGDPITEIREAAAVLQA